ncbi:unnamed protein product [Clonostachys solani]|uniref:Stress-response A/B barrel domain-containing protein n=1 Tax=Clonostachys solani TaxID=160281 RepID=A0A9N9Z970_9HYPO|nr:unnamed protein product [Clonostachys solani]
MAQQPIEHIVLYSFREHEALRTAVQYIKNLATAAKRNGEPYIRSIKCGTTRPAENVRSLGFNLASILVFESDDDRRYFVKDDPAHQELVAFIKGKLGKDILVLDFADGVGDCTTRAADC